MVGKSKSEANDFCGFSRRNSDADAVVLYEAEATGVAGYGVEAQEAMRIAWLKQSRSATWTTYLTHADNPSHERPMLQRHENLIIAIARVRSEVRP